MRFHPSKLLSHCSRMNHRSYKNTHFFLSFKPLLRNLWPILVTAGSCSLNGFKTFGVANIRGADQNGYDFLNALVGGALVNITRTFLIQIHPQSLHTLAMKTDWRGVVKFTLIWYFTRTTAICNYTSPGQSPPSSSKLSFDPQWVTDPHSSSTFDLIKSIERGFKLWFEILQEPMRYIFQLLQFWLNEKIYLSDPESHSAS